MLQGYYAEFISWMPVNIAIVCRTLPGTAILAYIRSLLSLDLAGASGSVHMCGEAVEHCNFSPYESLNTPSINQ